MKHWGKKRIKDHINLIQGHQRGTQLYRKKHNTPFLNWEKWLVCWPVSVGSSDIWNGLLFVWTLQHPPVVWCFLKVDWLKCLNQLFSSHPPQEKDKWLDQTSLDSATQKCLEVKIRSIFSYSFLSLWWNNQQRTVSSFAESGVFTFSLSFCRFNEEI